MPAFSSTSPLQGARDVNTGNPLAIATEDLAGKVAYLVSFANMATSALSYLTAQVSALNAAAVSAAASAATWSAFSTAPSALIGLGSFAGTFSNFRT
jgi:hypothetical protein